MKSHTGMIRTLRVLPFAVLALLFANGCADEGQIVALEQKHINTQQQLQDIRQNYAQANAIADVQRKLAVHENRLDTHGRQIVDLAESTKITGLKADALLTTIAEQGGKITSLIERTKANDERLAELRKLQNSQTQKQEEMGQFFALEKHEREKEAEKAQLTKVIEEAEKLRLAEIAKNKTGRTGSSSWIPASVYITFPPPTSRLIPYPYGPGAISKEWYSKEDIERGRVWLSDPNVVTRVYFQRGFLGLGREWIDYPTSIDHWPEGASHVKYHSKKAFIVYAYFR